MSSSTLRLPLLIKDSRYIQTIESYLPAGVSVKVIHVMTAKTHQDSEMEFTFDGPENMILKTLSQISDVLTLSALTMPSSNSAGSPDADSTSETS